MQKWYIGQNGQTQGPFDLSTMHEKRRAGEITPLHQIWNEVEGRWCLAFELGELYQFTEDESPWVLLKNNGDQSLSLHQAGPFSSGPYSTQQVSRLLLSGELSFEDYVWRSGYQRWAQIKTRSEFNHSLRIVAPSGVAAQEVMPASQPTADPQALKPTAESLFEKEDSDFREVKLAAPTKLASPKLAPPKPAPQAEIYFSSELRLALAIMVSLIAIVMLVKAKHSHSSLSDEIKAKLQINGSLTH